MMSRGKSCLLHLLMHDPLHAKQMSLSLMELIPMHDKDICSTSDKYAEKTAVRLSFFMVSDLDQSSSCSAKSYTLHSFSPMNF